jgi:hypothetical protein
MWDSRTFASDSQYGLQSGVDANQRWKNRAASRRMLRYYTTFTAIQVFRKNGIVQASD